MLALLRKEFLETIRWSPLGLLLICGLLFMAMQTVANNAWVAVTQMLAANGAMGGAVIAIGLGLLQSLNDQRNGPRAYLLHRAVSAKRVFWAKLIVGAGIYCLVCFIPLLLVAIWLESRGLTYQPTRAIQVLPTCVSLVGAFVFYPTMFLVVCRSASWIGSRSLPFLGVSMAQVGLNASLVVELPWLAFTGLITSTVLIVFVTAAKHAFVIESTNPAPSSNRSSLAQSAVVTISTMIVGCVVVMMAVEVSVRTFIGTRPNYESVICDPTGQPWLVTLHNKWFEQTNSFKETTIGGSPIRPGELADALAPVPTNIQKLPMAFASPSMYSPYTQYKDFAFSLILTQWFGSKWDKVYDRRGYLLFYNRYRHMENTAPLEFVVGRDGIRAPDETMGQPFASHDGIVVVIQTAEGQQGLLMQKPLALLCDRHGIYQLRQKDREVRQLVEQPVVSAYAIVDQEARLRLFVRTENQIRIYELSDESGDRKWLSSNNKDVGAMLISESPRLVAHEVETITVPAALRPLETLLAYYVSTGNWTLVGGNRNLPSMFARQTSGQTEPTVFHAKLPFQESHFLSGMGTALFAPPIAISAGSAITYWYARESEGKSLPEALSLRPSRIVLYGVITLIQALLSAVGALVAARHRALGTRLTTAWVLGGLLLGWTIPLALLACYPRIVREPCANCQRPRRVDLKLCEHCQAAWPRPVYEGIEILGPDKRGQVYLNA